VIEIDVRDLVGHPGQSREVRLDEPVEGLTTVLAAVPEGTPVEADLLLESVVEGILVSGPLRGSMRLSCARCLKTFERPFDVTVHEMFIPGRADEGDEYPLADDGGAIDIEPMVRDAVVLSMPFSPLCRPDCQGLCERCGGDRNLQECTCGPAPADPRWEALGDIRFDPEI
jgi:DUF177 domain-containing protein